MKPVFVPNIYPAFRCIAADCRHTCCVGWEIDVDEDALSRYRSVQGSLGARLAAGIDTTADPPCFRLTPDERCPFLNDRGLCDIITELGEGALCRICTDHPRFRHVQSDRVELGLGLCCEAAGALLLGSREPFALIELPAAAAAQEPSARGAATPPDPETLRVRALREAALAAVQQEGLPLGARLRQLCASTGTRLPSMPYAAWAEFLSELERLNPAWEDDLRTLSALDGTLEGELDGEEDPAYARLACYFLHRYLIAEDDGRPASTRIRVGFACLSAALIHALARAGGDTSPEALVEIARRYSSEIEYSEDNVETCFDLLEAVYDEYATF